MKAIAGTDIDTRWAFRPSTLEKEGITVVFKRTKAKKWSWRHFRFMPAIRIIEIWQEKGYSDFEPGNTKLIFERGY